MNSPINTGTDAFASEVARTLFPTRWGEGSGLTRLALTTEVRSALEAASRVSPSVPTSGGEVVAVPREPTPEMIEAAVKGSRADVSYFDAEETYRAMIAAAPAPPIPADGRDGIRVKDLVWVPDERTSTERAASVIGEYSVWEISGTGVFLPPGLSAGVLFGDTLDAAKSAAQEHYTNIVLSAIDTVKP